jgi:threonine dehydratase
LGVATAAALLHCSAKIFVPENVASAKKHKLQALGVELVLIGEDYDEAEAAGQAYARAHGLRFIHAFDDDEVIAGQGTVGLEIIEQFSAKSPLEGGQGGVARYRDERQSAPLENTPGKGGMIGTVLVPVGGGGLAGGVSLAIKSSQPEVKVFGIQSEASPAMHAALAQARVVETPIAETIADGLAGRFVTEKTLRLAQQYYDAMLLVSERTIRLAMRELFVRQGWRVEGSAAVGVAAILEGQVNAEGRECVVVISGGNIAEEVFAEAIQ